MAHAPTMPFDEFARRMPEVVAALRSLGQAAAKDLDKALVELVKVRVSQVNGCAFCLQLHLNWARRAGVPQEQLDRVAVWRESPGFADHERAALAWAESVTRPDPARVANAPRAGLHGHFTEDQQLQLAVTVATINAWNRIAGPLGFVPPVSEAR